MNTHIYRTDIEGDGNAVGNNNQITVIKHDNRQDNRRYGGAPNNGGGEGNPVAPTAIGVGLFIAAGSYYFARNADTVYTVLLLVSSIETLLALLATSMFVWRESYPVAAKAGTLSLLAGAVSLTLFFAHDNYPTQLTLLASASASVRDFWCGLSVFGRQLSLLHTVVVALGVTPAIFVLLPATIILSFFSVFPIEVSARTYGRLESCTSWGWAAIAAPLVIAAWYAHTASGRSAWETFIGDPPSLIFCPNRK